MTPLRVAILSRRWKLAAYLLVFGLVKTAGLRRRKFLGKKARREARTGRVMKKR